MARRVFFSFHYANDVQRSQVVKKSQFLKDKELAGFFDSSAMEEAKKKDDDSLRKFLKKEMESSSVVCVLTGEETAKRRWVKFEVLQGLMDKRGLIAVRVHGIANFDKKTCKAGPNPLDLLGVYSKDGVLQVIERASIGDKWTYTSDFGKTALPGWPYSKTPPANGSWPLCKYFSTHDWADEGHDNIGEWVEEAATQAGR